MLFLVVQEDTKVAEKLMTGQNDDVNVNSFSIFKLPVCKNSMPTLNF